MISALALLFDVAPTGTGAIGAVLGLVFFFILAAVAFIAYKMLRKTMKMAMRMTIVVAILVIALVGSFALFFLGSGSKPSKRPVQPTPAQRTR